MLQIIIFSFNRAMQLDTLLSSFQKYWKGTKYVIDVIYNTSNQDYEDGYGLLKEKCAQLPVYFHKECSSSVKPSWKELMFLDNLKRYIKYPSLRHPKSNFRELLIRVMKDGTSRHVMFMTDDAMYINETDIPDSVLEWISEKPTQRQFILRIGVGMNNQPRSIVVKSGKLLKWNMYQAPMVCNWGYNFSVDAHIYDKDTIVGLFEKLLFVNPNTLEDPVCREMRRCEMMGEAQAFTQPSLLSFPVNMVQTVANNESLGVDCKMLNDRYLQGYTMQYPIPKNITQFQIYPDYLRMFKDGKEEQLTIR